MDSTTGPETKIPHAMGQLNPSAITREKPMRLKEDLLIDAAQKKYSMLPLQGTWVRSLVGNSGPAGCSAPPKKRKTLSSPPALLMRVVHAKLFCLTIK